MRANKDEISIRIMLIDRKVLSYTHHLIGFNWFYLICLAYLFEFFHLKYKSDLTLQNVFQTCIILCIKKHSYFYFYSFSFRPLLKHSHYVLRHTKYINTPTNKPHLWALRAKMHFVNKVRRDFRANYNICFFLLYFTKGKCNLFKWRENKWKERGSTYEKKINQEKSK